MFWRSWRAGIASAALALCLGQTPAWSETGLFSRAEAIVLARNAFAAGDLLLASAIAKRILASNPYDSAALLLVAATGPELGEAKLARRSGSAAWRLARREKTPGGFRYEIARFTARAALVEGRPLVAQYWLRRSLDVAPDAASLARTQADLSGLQARTKLRYDLDFALAPSTNLTGGARAGALTIDDWYYVGPISATGQALSGTRATLRGKLSYRFEPGQTGQTELGLTAGTTLNRLSAASKAFIASDPQSVAAGGLRSADLNRYLLEASIARVFFVGKDGKNPKVTLAFGQSWSGRGAVGPDARLRLDLPLLTSTAGALFFATTTEWHRRGDEVQRGQSYQLDAVHRLGKGQLRLGLALDQQRTKFGNDSYDVISASLGYALEEPIGPLRLSAMLTGSVRDQDEFRLGPFAVTNGRHDMRLGLSVAVGFPDLAVMGFEPTLNLGAAATQSNISRYDTDEASVGLGVSARF